MANAWETVGAEYSRDQFHTRSTDGHGHQRHLRVNLPPNLFARMNQLIGEFSAYRTPQDVARDAIYHRLKYLNDHVVRDPQFDHVLAIEARKNELSRLQDELQATRELVDAARETVAVAAKNEDWIALSTAIEMAELEIDGLREPYATQLQEVVRDARKKYANKIAQAV